MRRGRLVYSAMRLPLFPGSDWNYSPDRAFSWRYRPVSSEAHDMRFGFIR